MSDPRQIQIFGETAGGAVGSILIDGTGRLIVVTAAAAPLLADVIDRAGRLVGIMYGDQGQLAQVPVTLELITQDTGLNTNPERYLHDNHWEPDAEITIAVVDQPGEQPVGGAVPAGETRRIRDMLIRHEGTNATVVTLLDVSGGNIKASIYVPGQTTYPWHSPDGRAIAATLQPVIQTSNVDGGSTYVTLSGVEA